MILLRRNYGKKRFLIHRLRFKADGENQMHYDAGVRTIKGAKQQKTI